MLMDKETMEEKLKKIKRWDDRGQKMGLYEEKLFLSM